MREQELKGCTFAKTVLMILIVVYHSVLFFGGNWFTAFKATVSIPLSYFASWLNSFHIYAFTLISGYLFYYLKYEKNKYNRFGAFVLGKVKRLIVPYVFASVFWTIPVDVYFFKYDLPTVLNKFLLGASPSHLWFLLMLFFVFVIFYPMSDYFKNNDLLGAITILAFFVVSKVGNRFISNYFQIFSALRYLTFFWIGFKLSQYGMALIKKFPWFIWLIADAVLFVLNNFIPSDGFILSLLSGGINYALNIVGSITAFLILQLISDKIKWQSNRVFCLLSKISMPIYLFHQQLIYISIALLTNYLNPYLLAPVNFILSFTLSTAISYLLMLTTPTSFLVGEKPLKLNKRSTQSN